MLPTRSGRNAGKVPAFLLRRSSGECRLARGRVMKWEFSTTEKLCRRLMLAVAIALSLSTVASVAQAQTEVRTPYQQYLYTTNCVPCILNFSAVPARHRLEVSNVSCYIRWDAVANPMYVDNVQLLVLNSSNALITASTLAPIPVHTLDPQVPHSRLTFAANHAVAVFAPAGHHFRAMVDTTGGAAANFFACHVSGQMVKLG